MHFFEPDGHLGWTAFCWFLGAMVIAVLFRVVVNSRRFRGGAEPESPEALLKRKYSEGEIDQQTYARMREELKNSTKEK